jgi:predicted DNA-binding protein (UPF0251 family)
MLPQYKKPGACACPAKGKVFKPAGIPLTDSEKIVPYTDELEEMKLCDLDGLTQEEAGAKMGISRGTVQRILSDTRRTTAFAPSDCKALVFEKTPCKEED